MVPTTYASTTSRATARSPRRARAGRGLWDLRYRCVASCTWAASPEADGARSRDGGRRRVGRVTRSPVSPPATRSSSIRPTTSWAGWAAAPPKAGLTPLLLVREAARRRLFHVPGGMSLRVAALTEPLAVGPSKRDARLRWRRGTRCRSSGAARSARWPLPRWPTRVSSDVVAIDLSRASRRNSASSSAPLTCSTRRLSTCQGELARLHGRHPFMFGPTPATDVFIEASGQTRVIAEIRRARGAAGGRMSVSPCTITVADELRPTPDETVHDPRLVRVSAEVRGRD